MTYLSTAFLLALVAACSGQLISSSSFRSNSETITLQTRKNIQASATLNCAAGDEGDEYELTISPIDAEVRLPYPNALQVQTSDGVQVAQADDPGSSGVFKVSGKLHSLTEGEAVKDCQGKDLSECAKGKTHSGLVSVKQHILVESSITPLAWPAKYTIKIECRIVPKNPEGEDLIDPEENPGPNLQLCEKFAGQLNISILPPPGECLIVVQAKSETMAPLGIGYSLKSCTINGAQSRTILINNGKTVNGPQVYVTGRQTGRTPGEFYELHVRGLDPTSTAAGVVSCEIERCRYGALTFETLDYCPTGVLPTSVGRSALFENGGRSASQQLDIRPGQITLLIDDVAGAARSAPREKRCESSE